LNFQNEEKKKRVSELGITLKNLPKRRKKRVSNSNIEQSELLFQNEEKKKELNCIPIKNYPIKENFKFNRKN
jgi:hypothetical protein